MVEEYNFIPQWWEDWADKNWAVRFVDATLRGAGQVFFQNNPITGILFVIGIVWAGIVTGAPAVPIGTVAGVTIATATALLLNVDEKSWRMGLYGFNGALLGTAVPTFLKADPLMWLYLVIGAAVSTVVMLAISNVLGKWGVAALTSPFVLTTWLLLLGAYSFSRIGIATLPTPIVPAATTSAVGTLYVSVLFVLETVFLGISQVYLIQNVVTGIIFTLAIFVNSRWSGIFAVFGSGLALATALTFAPKAASISAGLFGFSAVLTAIAVGGNVFNKPSWEISLYAALAIVFTTIVQGAMDVALTPVGIPTLTGPFVLTTWLFLLPSVKLAPVPHTRMPKPPPVGKAKS